VPFIVVIFPSVSDEFYLLTRTGHSFIDVAKESTPKASIASKVSTMKQIFDEEDDKPFTLSLKGPKREIFGLGIFAQIRPIWIGYLGTRPKNPKQLRLGPILPFISRDFCVSAVGDSDS
jgi:hypothetical protein